MYITILDVKLCPTNNRDECFLCLSLGFVGNFRRADVGQAVFGDSGPMFILLPEQNRSTS